MSTTPANEEALGNDVEPLVTTNYVAELFSVSNETVRDWIKKGHIEGVKINGYWRVKRASVVAFANSRYGGAA